MVDDGSTDDTSSVLAELSGMYKHVSTYRTPNGGLSSARNFGISRSVGRYIVLLDADDELIPMPPVELFDGEFDIIRVGVEEVNVDESVTLRTECHAPATGIAYLDAHFRRRELFPASWAYYYRREFLQSNNLRFLDRLLHEDLLFTVEAILKADVVTSVPEVGYRYFRRPGSITSGTTYSQIDARLRSLALIAHRITSRANVNPEVDLGWWSLDVIQHAQSVAAMGSSPVHRWKVLMMMVRFFREYKCWGQYRTFSDMRHLLGQTAQWFVMGLKIKLKSFKAW